MAAIKHVSRETTFAVLGEEGITGKAVLETLNRLGFVMVPVSEADVIVVSPGIPPAQYPDVNGEFISEIECAFRIWPLFGSLPFLIGITGSNGKSTVTMMVAHCLDCPATGNIGTPLIQYVANPNPPKKLAIELSSYQLETCTTFKPDVAVLMNITPDHMARHGSMANYAREKAKIFQAMGPDDAVIYFENDPYLPGLVTGASVQKIPFSLHHPMAEKVSQFPQLRGDHNILNGVAAWLICEKAGISESAFLEKLATFVPLPHRLEPVPSSLPFQFFNDSKATNPDATLQALSAFKDPIHLLIGGEPKGLDIRAFYDDFSKKTTSITVYGNLAKQFEDVQSNRFFRAATLQEAVNHLVTIAKPKDVILLSPAAASFDQFLNFEDRGQKFRDMVKDLCPI